MLSPERLSLPGPEYLGEERGGAAGQRPEGPVPWVCCGLAWRGGSAGLGVAVARPGLPGDSGERPQARGVSPGWVGSGRAEAGRSDSVSAFWGVEGTALGGFIGWCCGALLLRVFP